MACYRSEQYDPDLGLYYLRARYYNPATGRFLSVDPLADEGQRRYEYAAANPVDGMDPNGSEALIEYALVPHILPPVWIPNWCGLFGANPMGGNLPCKHQQPGKHFDYLIDSGALFKVDASGYPTYMGSGYSGKGAGLNNPSMEDVKGAKGKNDAGPIPEGKYTIGLNMLILVEWTVGNSLYGPGYDDMPPPKTSEQALYIYVSESLRKALNSLKADSRLKSANKAPRMTYRKLMRRMIEEVSASEKLETAIRSYFLDHNSRPADSNQTIKIRICQDEETLALASALAFRIRGTGNISEVCRLIIRYYVDHSLVHGLVSSLKAESNKIVVAADQAKAMVVPFVESPRISLMRRGYGDHREKTKYIATSFYLDTETVDLLAEFVQRMHVKSIAFTSQLIEQYLADDIRFKILKDSDVLLEDPPSSKSSVVKRFNFTKETNALLEDLCVNVLASSNKSAMIRALIKVEAGLQGIRDKRRTKRIHAPKRAVGGK